MTVLGQTDRMDLRPAQRIGLCSLAAWSAGLLLALAFGPRAAAGVALGGGVILAFFALHLALARAWLAAERPRYARLYLWCIWLVKWPLVSLLLYAAMRSGLASPPWLCLGVAILPAVATLLALHSLAAPAKPAFPEEAA